jgi:hypothetical protein
MRLNVDPASDILVTIFDVPFPQWRARLKYASQSTKRVHSSDLIYVPG